MSNKRGKRGSSSSKKFAVVLKIRNEEQLQRTLDLRGVNGDKPCINNIIGCIVERIQREEDAEMLAIAKRWRDGYKGWPSSMLYECMGEDYPGWDDELGYDPYEEIYDGLARKGSRKLKELNKKLFKKGKRDKVRYRNGLYDEDDYWSNRHTMFNRGEWSDDDLDDEDNYDGQYKSIKFYDDIENELGVREFHSLKEFNDFCDARGYKISPTDYNNLINGQVIHCCLDPISLEYGENEIITDNSYGALYWAVSEDITKHEENSLAGARTFTD